MNRFDKTDEMSNAFWSATALDRTKELLQRTADDAEKQRKDRARAERALFERRRDKFGRWARTGGRCPKDGRDKINVSIPAILADKIRVEADDCKYPYSRMVVVLAYLGLPIWQKYRGELLLAKEPPEYTPAIVKAIVQSALGPRKSSFVQQKWRNQVHEDLVAEGQRLKEQRHKRMDTTDLMTEQFMKD